VRKRFVTFINKKAEKQQDPHIQFAEVRGQIRPKTEVERDLTRIPVVEA
jgi:nitrite reductase (NADH) large subunit